MKERQGLTLIETIITLSILSILLVIGTPNSNIFANYYRDMELQTIKRDFGTARTKAVAEGRIYTVHILEDGHGYIIRNNEARTRNVVLEYVQFLSTSNERLHFTSKGSFLNPDTIYLRDHTKAIYSLKIGVATSKISLEKE